MKIKTLLLCFLAVTISLTSCKKENYAEKFVGSYKSSVTISDYKLSIPLMEMEETFESETVTDVLFSITQVGETQDVNVVFPINLDQEIMQEIEEMESSMGVDVNIPENLLFTGTCDETGLHINPFTYSESISVEEEMGVGVNLSLSLGGTTVADPANFTCTSPLNVTFAITIPDEYTGMGVDMTIDGTLIGNININAVKQ